ncbi:TetR/AcrR family transcriptional regulator [Nocardiopsis tropica]|uniref:TetR/AcrR family transcriptional regulator C-terminal domain-containing protein n=1 Tax=Nocardiopsis tropica TaxID=109330 RepID=A0ABU7KPN3_9ACTN|nr:TetR/AcrR family transcriptional regulator C-terminal domain-containing protein [Nocardiopsis umidischolae]MEE2051082.1 TetR/AcrR family transcriptional regulator C-terminal domain-containing protein [Nocardiopsis umidischolae]
MTTSRSRGQHAGLDRRGILRAAVRLVDREGLTALSMRRLGAEVGVKAMALYHHFPNKDALLDGMVEEIATAAPVGFEGTDWWDGLRGYARAQLDALAAHPNLIPLVLSRPATTAGNHLMMETLLRSLRTAGFQPLQALDMVYTLNALILVHAALGAGVGGAPPPHGEPGQTSRLAALPAQTYPLLAEAAHAGADRGPTARFEFALDALLTGFADARGAS